MLGKEMNHARVVPDRARPMDTALLAVLFITGLIICSLGYMAHHFRFVAGGLLLSLVAIWSFTLAEDRTPRFYAIALSVLLAVGLALRLIAFTDPRFSYDEWDLMAGVGGSFKSYMALHRGYYTFAMLAHYWLSHRLLGSGLFNYRILSGLTSVSLLLAAFFGLRRFWPKTTLLVALCFLAFNTHAIELTWYAEAPYGISLLVSSLAFLLFMRMADGPLQKKHWLLVCICIPPAAALTNVTTIVPVAAGAMAAAAIYYRRPLGPGLPGDSRRLLGELTPFLLFPVVYVLGWALFPLAGLLGAAKRPELASLFFPTSGFGHSLGGAAAFMVQRTYGLFRQVLATGFSFTSVALGLFAFCLLLAGVQSIRSDSDRRVAFALVFLVGCMAVVAAGGLLGLYPYGSVRYASYLVVPIAVILGSGCAWVYRWLDRQCVWRRSWRALVLFLVLLPLPTGIHTGLQWNAAFAKRRLDNSRALAWIHRRTPDLILLDNRVLAYLQEISPEITKRSIPMGWGTSEGDSLVPPNVGDLISAAGLQQPPLQVLVISNIRPLDRYFPAWNTLLRNYYFLLDSTEAPDLGAKLFRRKGDGRMARVDAYTANSPGWPNALVGPGHPVRRGTAVQTPEIRDQYTRP